MTRDLLQLQVVFVKLSATQYNISQSSRFYLLNCLVVARSRKLWKLQVYFNTSALTIVWVLSLLNVWRGVGTTNVTLVTVDLIISMQVVWVGSSSGVVLVEHWQWEMERQGEELGRGGGAGCNNKATFWTHRHRHHKAVTDAEMEATYKCQTCDYSCTKKDTLGMHIKDSHWRNSRETGGFF